MADPGPGSLAHAPSSPGIVSEYSVDLAVGVVGFLASCMSFVLWLPQATRVWRMRRNPELLAGVSVLTQVLLLANVALWATYAALAGAFWVGAPGIVQAPLAIMTIVLVRRGRWRPLERDLLTLAA